jgi:hypothetical protein
MTRSRYLYSILFSLLICHTDFACGQGIEGFAGQWVINEELSDNTDKHVETALRAAGEKVRRKLFDFRKDRYRGGPPEQELYDRISYDNELSINLDSDTYLFTYADDFRRPVYTDNRSRSVSLANLDEEEDFSFAHWEDNKLLVEARPRDGGFADETYTLVNNGTQLQVELYIKPKNFQVPVEIRRIYDRKP